MAGNSNYAPLIIICLALFACLIVWFLILHYAIRSGISNIFLFKPDNQYNDIIKLIDEEVHIAWVIAICVLAFFALLAAILLIIANVYCVGLSSLGYFDNYCKQVHI